MFMNYRRELELEVNIDGHIKYQDRPSTTERKSWQGMEIKMNLQTCCSTHTQ